MRVWVLEEQTWDSGESLAVFSNEETARIWKERLQCSLVDYELDDDTELNKKWEMYKRIAAEKANEYRGL